MSGPAQKVMKRFALTDNFTLVVGEPLDRDAFAAAVRESKMKVRLWDPRHPSRDDTAVDRKRLNVRINDREVITCLHYG